MEVVDCNNRNKCGWKVYKCKPTLCDNPNCDNNINYEKLWCYFIEFHGEKVINNNPIMRDKWITKQPTMED
jgi:hypothetical protein